MTTNLMESIKAVVRRVPGSGTGRAAVAFCGGLSLVLSACVWLGALVLTGGEFVYPLDDSYIHISLAKTLAESGTWGLSPGSWAFCSSSPLWTLLLAGLFRLFGVVEWIPLVLSVACNAGAAMTAARFLSAFPDRISVGWRVAGLMLLTPFAVTGALGMEHALHVWLILSAFAWFVLDGRSWRILPLAFLATATRYESLFVLLPLAAAVCAANLRTDRRKALLLGVGTVLSAALPVGLYGWYAMSHGGHFLPVSLLFKGNTGGLTSVLRGVVGIVSGTSASNFHMRLALAVLALLACFRPLPRGLRTAAGALFVATGGHLVFAKVGWLYRYEAYLLAAAVLLTLAAARTLRTARGLRVGVAAVLAVLALRGGYASYRAMTAPRDIRSQQVALAKMFAALPKAERGTIAVNDVGYLSLHAGAPVLDLWGLGSADVAELKIRGALDKPALEALFARHDVRYVAVFDSWFPRAALPDGLRLVRVLRTPGNRTCGDDKVHVYERRREGSAGQVPFL